MKKIAFIILSLSAMVLITNGQNCTNCDENNVVSPENHSSALGIENTSTGQASFASGKWNEATNVFTSAFGFRNTASGPASVAIGNNVVASGGYSIGLGSYIETSGARSMTLGSGAAYGNPLKNIHGNSLMIGFGSSKHTFFINTSPESDGTGSVGIGDVTNLQAKLHIKGDDTEDADLLLDAAPEKYAAIKFGTGNNGIKAKPQGDLKFYSAADFVFSYSNVGISVENPTEKLEVDGTIKSTGLVLNNGTQATGKILQSDATGLASWVDPTSINDGDWETNGDDIYNMNSGNVGIGVDNPIFNLHIKKSATLGLQNENTVVGGEIASITAGDANYANKAKIVFKNGGDWGESSEIAFYTSEEYTGNLHKAITISESKTLRCHGGATFEGVVSFSNNIFLNGNWIKNVGGASSGGIFLGNQNKVGIGTDTPGAALDVNGGIKANSIEVGSMAVEVMEMASLKVTGLIEAGEIEVKNMKEWEDKVFEDSYDLATLSEVEVFIKENGHLPEIPSEAEVLDKGYKMGEMDAMLLKKIEELTLYVIKQQKEIDKLKNK